MHPSLRVASALVLLALVAAPFVSSNHLQAESGRTVSFDHKTGNEWWVEVTMAGPDAAAITKVEAMDTNGPWTALPKRSASVYGGSFHIEPGHQVRFRAMWSDGDVVTSCWFTHPAGAEQCSTTTTTTSPPPTGWQTTVVGETGDSTGDSGDLAISDVDNDGRRDVVVASDNGLQVFEWTGDGYNWDLVSPRSFGAVAAGDGDGDGDNEIYAVSVQTLYIYEKVNGVWDEEPRIGFFEWSAGDMTIGNIDGAAGPEIYVGMYNTTCDPETGLCSSTSSVSLVRKASALSPWTSTRIMDLAGHIDSFWIGDGDRDGSSELYVGHGTRHADITTQVRQVGGVWEATRIGGGGSDSGMALAVVGDGNRDGKSEVYMANWYGNLLKITYSPTAGWTQETLFAEMMSPEGQTVHPTSLSLGDADNDGSQELYFATGYGELYQVRWNGAVWQLTRISYPSDDARGKGFNGLLVVGDGDSDGRREAYLTVSFQMPNTGEDGVTRLYKVAIPAPGAFDAAFTGVRGNQWWEQVSVAATGGTLAKVDVRLNGGAWQTMTKQSYGWTASIRAVEGTIVQFRATATSGSTDLSDCYRWIPPANTDASKVPCGGTTTTTTTSSTTTSPGAAFDATFSGVKGNEWWVQASVSGNQPIQDVAARIGCSEEWHSLTKQSYGWAASFHVPPGSKVDFRAISTSGNMDFSGGYIWPQATPTSAC